MSDDFIKRMKSDSLYWTESNLVSSNGQEYKFGTCVYDVMHFHDMMIVSVKDMPIRIYKHTDLVAKIHDHKHNSEIFLTPLEIKQHDQSILGCGKGFLKQYDVNTLQVTNFKSVAYPSCLDCSIENQSHNLTKNLCLVGDFDRSISIHDLSSDKIIGAAKIHIGGVTQVSFDLDNSLYFHTCARQDDLVYTWDLRNPSRFLSYYKRHNSTNQRTGFYIKNDLAIMGNDDGTAYIYNDGHCSVIPVNDTQTCVHSSVIVGTDIYFAYGQRTFQKQHSTGILRIPL